MTLNDLNTPDNANTMGVCEHCEEETGTMRINPYDQEIKSIDNWEFICGKCYHELCQEI